MRQLCSRHPIHIRLRAEIYVGTHILFLFKPVSVWRLNLKGSSVTSGFEEALIAKASGLKISPKTLWYLLDCVICFLYVVSCSYKAIPK